MKKDIDRLFLADLTRVTSITSTDHTVTHYTIKLDRTIVFQLNPTQFLDIKRRKKIHFKY